MATVTMPDGATVEMPDQLDPALGARLRAFHDAATKPEPQSTGSKIAEATLGPSELLASGAANIPGAAVNAVSDLVQRIGGNDSAPPLVPSVPVGESGRNLMHDIGGMIPDAVPNALHSADQTLQTASPVTHDLVHGALGVGSDVANLLPAAGAAEEGISVLKNAAVATAAAKAPLAAGDISGALKAVGYRSLPSKTATAGTGARLGESIVGDGPLAGHQTLTNQAVTDALARHEAGLAPGTELNPTNLAQARTDGPAKIYDQVQAALPQSMDHDPQLTAAINGVNESASQLPKVPDVEGLKDFMAGQTSLTPGNLFANIQDARARATKAYRSDLPTQQDMGDAYRGIANAYEEFAERQLGKNPASPVNIDDFRDARTQFAKSHDVQNALQGTSVNASKVGRLLAKGDADGGSDLTGGLRLIGEQHNRNQLSTGFGPTTLPDSGIGTSGSPAGMVARHVTGPIIGGSVGTAIGGPVGGAAGTAVGLGGSVALQQLLRRVLAGSPEAAGRIAEGAGSNPQLADFFNPPEPPQKPPAPLELQPPPGQAFSPHQPQLAFDGPTDPNLPPGRGAERNFFGTRIGGMTASTPTGPGNALPGRSNDFSLADVLSSRDLEQNSAEDLSFGPMGAPTQEGLPFRVYPDSIGARPVRSGRQIVEPVPSHIMGEDGPIETGMGAESPIGDRYAPPQLADLLSDLPAIMHQGHAVGLEDAISSVLGTTPGVPEDALQRSAKPFKPNKRDRVDMNLSDLLTPTYADIRARDGG